MVIRARLYESDPGRMRVALDRVLGPIGVRRVAVTVTGIDTDARQVSALGRDGDPLELTYGRLVLAAGSRVVAPPVKGAEHLFDVDTMPGASRLHSHIGRQFTAVVVGGGFTGIEVATELPDRLRAVAGGTDVRVVLVEQSDVVGPELCPGPRPEILAALTHAGVEVRLGVRLTAVDRASATLSDGTVIPTGTVVWTAGMRASALTSQIPGTRDSIGRLLVDRAPARRRRRRGLRRGRHRGGGRGERAPRHAELSARGAAGQAGRRGRRCRRARPAVGTVLPQPVRDLSRPRSVRRGAVPRLGPRDRADGAEAKQLKKSINADWIYPPVDDAAAILALADHHITWPTEAVDTVDAGA